MLIIPPAPPNMGATIRGLGSSGSAGREGREGGADDSPGSADDDGRAGREGREGGADDSPGSADDDGRPGRGGSDSGPAGLAAPGRMSRLAADIRPLLATGSVLTELIMLMVSVRSFFSCSSSWFLLSNTVNLFLSKLISPCNSVSFLSACLAATQFS